MRRRLGLPIAVFVRVIVVMNLLAALLCPIFFLFSRNYVIIFLGFFDQMLLRSS